MRLVRIVKYALDIILNKKLIFSGILVFLCIRLSAQTYKIEFKNETLARALVRVSEQFNIKVAFDANKAGAVYLNKQVTGNTPEEFMQNLLSGLTFNYVYKHNRYLIVDKPLPTPNEIVACQLLGTITDTESGEQLPYAAVMLPELDLNTYASSTGSFVFKNIEANPFHLVINFIGYAPLDTIVHWIHPNFHYNFKLKRKVQVVDTVVVVSPKLEMIDFRNDVDFATTINTSKLIDLPILAETDIFRTLQLLPGISYSENSSELSIHGGSSDQNLILFDGQTLYNLSHYYGVISSINPNVIKDVQVYKGGYDSRYGERVSGIVDITAKSGSLYKPRVYGDINLVSGNVTAELPLNNKLSVIAAFRRSYSDIYASEFVKTSFKNKVVHFLNDSSTDASITTPSFRFYDYNTKLTYRLSDKENIAIGVYGGKDFFSNSYVQPTHGLVVYNKDENTWSNYGISAGWIKQWNTSLLTNWQFGSSGYSNKYHNETSVDRSYSTHPDQNALPNVVNAFEKNDKNTVADLSLSLKNTYVINNSHQLYFGALFRENTIQYNKIADKIYVYDDITESNLVSSLYFLDKFKLNQIFTIKPGIRFNYYDGTKKIYLEPRAALGIDVTPKISFRLAFGRYTQFLSQVGSQQETGYIKNFWILADGKEHPVLTSNHYVVGGDIQIGNFLFDVEAYYKQLYGIQEYFYIPNLRKNTDFDKFFPRREKTVPAPPNEPSFFIHGKGKAYGLDFLLQYKREFYTAWISYSLGRSLQNFEAINQGSDIPAPTDQLHQLSFTNMVSVGKWNLGSIMLFSSGSPYFQNHGDYTDPSINRTYQRLPNFSRVDASINRTFNLGKPVFKLGASVINVFNSQNYYDINIRDINYETQSFSNTNVIRSQARSLNLFLHFSF